MNNNETDKYFVEVWNPNNKNTITKEFIGKKNAVKYAEKIFKNGLTYTENGQTYTIEFEVQWAIIVYRMTRETWRWYSQDYRW